MATLIIYPNVGYLLWKRQRQVWGTHRGLISKMLVLTYGLSMCALPGVQTIYKARGNAEGPLLGRGKTGVPQGDGGLGVTRGANTYPWEFVKFLIAMLPPEPYRRLHILWFFLVYFLGIFEQLTPHYIHGYGCVSGRTTPSCWLCAALRTNADEGGCPDSSLRTGGKHSPRHLPRTRADAQTDRQGELWALTHTHRIHTHTYTYSHNMHTDIVNNVVLIKTSWVTGWIYVHPVRMSGLFQVLTPVKSNYIIHILIRIWFLRICD